MLRLAAICLNEEEFIGAWLHYHYPSFYRIVICEGAARNYPRTTIFETGFPSTGSGPAEPFFLSLPEGL